MKTKWDGKAQILIPTLLVVCPECGAQIEADVYEVTYNVDDEWCLREDGSGLHIQCTKEDNSHYQMPYVDWLPIEGRVIEWLNENYDFTPDED